MVASMQRITPVARIVLGLIFLVFGLNYFVPFLPQQPIAPDALAFVMAFAGSGMLTLIKVIEVAAAVALLANRAVPLALALLAPIIVGITAFHARLAPDGMLIVLAVLALELVLAWSYRNAFAPMLRWRVTPAPAREVSPPATAAARAA